jgi:hypothetical protein
LMMQVPMVSSRPKLGTRQFSPSSHITKVYITHRVGYKGVRLKRTKLFFYIVFLLPRSRCSLDYEKASKFA